MAKRTSRSTSAPSSTRRNTQGTPPRSKRTHSQDDSMFHNFMSKRDLAISWIKDYLPALSEKVDLDRLQVEPNEFHARSLSKWVADVVYSIPLRDSPNHAKVAVILEHKSRIAQDECRVAIAQTLTYLASQCLREAKETKAGTVIPQPLAVVVYTGSNRKLTKISWNKFFPVLPGLEKFGMHFDLVVLNMANLLAQNKSPQNEWLDAMYNIMTRSKAEELDGYEHKAFLPLLRHSGEWTSTEAERVTALTTLYSAHIQIAKLARHDERITTLFNSIDLEKKMGTNALYQMFAPAAEKSGIVKGIGIGREEGIQQERLASLKAQRQELCSAIKGRFGSCPNALRSAFAEITNLNALFKLHTFALTEAKSTSDILERAKSVMR